MDSITELAREIRARDNAAAYSPVFGIISALPELQIRIGDRILLDSGNVTAIFDLYEHVYDDGVIEYVNLGKTVVLLPHSNGQKYIALGVVV